MFAALDLYEYAGNLHIHTPYSDGESYHHDIAQAALRAGLDFIVITDHNVLVRGVQGYYGDDQRGYLLVMTGEEIHDQTRDPQVNHLLVYGVQEELAQCAYDPQLLIDAVNAADGICFLAHPDDQLLAWIHEPAIPWVSREVHGFTGLEIWNYMSSTKELLQRKRDVLSVAFRPEQHMTAPNPATLALWDELLAQGKKIVGIGNADAHGTVYRLGLFAHTMYPYDYLFNCVNTHVLLPEPFSGKFERDQRAIFKALRDGHCFIGYDLPHSTRGFRFSAHGQGAATFMGGTISIAEGQGITLQAIAPARSHLKMIHNGKVIAEATNRENLTVTAHEVGAYRVEVWQTFWGRERMWILSNPIYLETALTKR